MNRIYKFLPLILAAVFFTACEDDSKEAVLGTGSAPVLENTDSTLYTFTEKALEDTFNIFSWQAVKFDVPVAVNYTLQMDLADSNFANAITLMETTETSAEILIETINNALLKWEYTSKDTAKLEARVTARLINEARVLESNVIEFGVIPFKSETVVIEYPKIFVPGSHQGWGPDKPDAPFVASLNSDDKFEGYVYFSAGDEFKFTDGPSWDLNWGDDGADGTLDPNGANIKADVEGMYRLKVDKNALTYTKELTNWGLIGDATPGGWGADTDLVYEDGLLKVTLDLTAGEIKFRANDDWALNLGDNDADGSLEEGGANIAVADPGNYTVVLDLSNAPSYTYTVTKN